MTKNYALVGYDKDYDAYEVIEIDDDLECLKGLGVFVAKKQSKTDCFRRKQSNEPFDWFGICGLEDSDYPDEFYWVSYK